MSSQSSAVMATISTHTLTIEQKRVLLYRALAKDPQDQRVREALQATLTPGLVQHASRHGIYVCYHRADEVFALDISMSLQEARVKVWMDEMDVPETAEDWRGAVDAALRACGTMLLVLSPDLVSDADTLNEYRRFVRAGKIVIPVLHRACDMSRGLAPAQDADWGECRGVKIDPHPAALHSYAHFVKERGDKLDPPPTPPYSVRRGAKPYESMIL